MLSLSRFNQKIMLPNSEKQHEIKDLVAIANISVEGLEPELKKIGFKTILESLLNQGRNSNKNTILKAKTRKNNKKIVSAKNSKPSISKKELSEKTKELLEKIIGADHPLMHEISGTLEKIVYLLYIVRKKCPNITGLTTFEISKILEENFRIKMSRNNANMSLNTTNAKKITYRKPENGEFIYILAHSGEKYIEEKIETIGSKK